MMWKKVISMLLVAAMLAMPIGCGKDGNKDKDTTSGVETTDIGDDSAETDAPPKTPVPKEDKETKESDKDTDTENETDFSDDDYEPAQVTKKEYESMSAQDLIDRIKDVKNITEDQALALYSTYAYTNYTEDFYSREENITDEAFKILKDDGCKIPYTTTIRDNMLHSENANVRAYAFTTIGGLFGTSSTGQGNRTCSIICRFKKSWRCREQSGGCRVRFEYDRARECQCPETGSPCYRI